MNRRTARNESTSLADQSVGFRGLILQPQNGNVPWRLRELGFVPGTTVSVLRRGPLGDPLELELRGYRICLRRSDLAPILIEPLSTGVARVAKVE